MNNKEDYLLSREETAKLLGIKPETLSAWSHHKRYNLSYIKIGRLVKYRYSDIMDFIKKQTRGKQEGEAL